MEDFPGMIIYDTGERVEGECHREVKYNQCIVEDTPRTLR